MSDSNSKKAFPLRISERLFEQIRKWANEDLRSVNSQIEFLLNEAIKKRESTQGKGSEFKSGKRTDYET